MKHPYYPGEVKGVSKNTTHMIGLILMIVSIFPILAGLFITEELLPGFTAPVVLSVGVLLLAAGVILYKIVKSE